MFKYIHTIRYGASRTVGLAFKCYDEQFCIKKGRNQDMPLGVVDWDLWLMYMYKNMTSRSSKQLSPAQIVGGGGDTSVFHPLIVLYYRTCFTLQSSVQEVAQ